MDDTAEGAVDGVPVTDPATMWRAVAAAAVGNITEWFDFGVYGYLATTIEAEFFPPGPLSQVAVFATFAIAFFFRPLGGLFFGPLGDRIGRTKVLSITVILMALGTFLIGLIPSYASIGLAAPILLVAARVLQGFSTGGEYAGAMTFIAEYAPDRRRGYFGSFLELGTFVGYALGATIAIILILAFLVVPIFALANAGVSFEGMEPAALLAPLPLGIALGLLIGKQLGIVGLAWLAVKSGIARLPQGVGWLQVWGLSLIAGIGFTMSLFIGNLAFADPAMINAVKLGVLAGSIVSALLGVTILLKGRRA